MTAPRFHSTGGSSCLDPLGDGGQPVPVTQRIKLLVALRTPAGAIPVASARRQAATLDQALSGACCSTSPGGDATELAADGIHLAHDERLRQRR